MELSSQFTKVLGKVHEVGREVHTQALYDHAKTNRKYIDKSIKDCDFSLGDKSKSAIVVSAGPSLHKFDILKRIKDSGYTGTIVCVDGSYVKCLKAGITPDYCLSLDPHKTRIVRWFGDHDFEKNSENDDYFKRQDLDVDFRKNTIIENKKNIELVNENGSKTKLLVATSAPENVVQRGIEAKFDMYWWNPLVDNPREPDSITKQLYDINKLPCMNTGGTVGSAAWVFVNQYLNVDEVAVVGMDLGYHSDTPIEMTQTYYELHEFIESEDDLKELFPKFVFPLDNREYYTDPTYFWYRRNLLQMLEKARVKTFNCSEGGTLVDPLIECLSLDDFLAR